MDERGIEANPDKIQAIISMKSPKTVKVVQRLTGCVAALSHFMSKSADRCSSFFKALKQQRFVWNEEAEEAFLNFKSHLVEMPKLVLPLPGEI